jgi:hypothetical protein
MRTWSDSDMVAMQQQGASGKVVQSQGVLISKVARSQDRRRIAEALQHNILLHYFA